MAVDGFMYFLPYTGEALKSEATSNFDNQGTDPLMDKFPFKTYAGDWNNDKRALFEVEDFSFDIEQTLNIGSQSTGAGAGKVTFNPFSITRKIDKSSPVFFQMACSGTAFKQVVLGLRKSAGGSTTGKFYLCFCFKLVAVKTISWSYDDESPKETVTFEYGGLQVHYTPQKPSGEMATPIVKGGWNRVKNTEDTEPDVLIQ